MSNTNFNIAKRKKMDEFYTFYVDIEQELEHYTEHFKGKTVYCNCDDYIVSSFYQYFYDNFEKLQLKHLVATYFNETPKTSSHIFFGDDGTVDLIVSAIRIDYDGEEEITYPLKGDGDFRSPACIDILKQADIVCTNPPFSLFKEYVAQLVEHDKKFLILGHQGAISYKDIFPLILKNKMWLGMKIGSKEFKVPLEYEGTVHRRDDQGNKIVKMGNIVWYTNLPNSRRAGLLDLQKEYDPALYPTYDNYDAIEVGPIKNIPKDYFGLMGVPLTFLVKHNPEQFVIEGMAGSSISNTNGLLTQGRDTPAILNGKRKYVRLLIRRTVEESGR